MSRARFPGIPYFRGHSPSVPQVPRFANRRFIYLCFVIASSGEVNPVSVNYSLSRSLKEKNMGFLAQNFIAYEKNVGETARSGG